MCPVTLKLLFDCTVCCHLAVTGATKCIFFSSPGGNWGCKHTLSVNQNRKYLSFCFNFSGTKHSSWKSQSRHTNEFWILCGQTWLCGRDLLIDLMGTGVLLKPRSCSRKRDAARTRFTPAFKVYIPVWSSSKVNPALSVFLHFWPPAFILILQHCWSCVCIQLQYTLPLWKLGMFLVSTAPSARS